MCKYQKQKTPSSKTSCISKSYRSLQPLNWWVQSSNNSSASWDKRWSLDRNDITSDCIGLACKSFSSSNSNSMMLFLMQAIRCRQLKNQHRLLNQLSNHMHPLICWCRCRMMDHSEINSSTYQIPTDWKTVILGCICWYWTMSSKISLIKSYALSNLMMSQYDDVW